MGNEREKKRGERMKGRGRCGCRAWEGERRDVKKGRNDIYDPRKTEALSRSGDLGKEGRECNGREEE